MLKVRLQRTGRENVPTYRIVVAEKSKSVKGAFKEIVGHYLPTRNPVTFEHNDERIRFWVKNGAIPSETVARLLFRAGMKEMEKYMTPYTKRKPRKEVEAGAPAPAAPPAPEKSDNAPQAA